jgi:tRNA modification GTPase
MLSFDTIVAPATPPGEGGVGIVRLSGPCSVEILGSVFRGKRTINRMESHHLYHGHLLDGSGSLVDEVLAVIMRGPRSYTGEDVVEVHCHGGTQIQRCVLDLFLATGARMALPGEFTQRAFLNGRLDLAQAEAVVSLIGARSERASRVALAQLDGTLSQRVYQYSSRLKDSLALLEAHIDFPDDEVGTLDLSSLSAAVKNLSSEMSCLMESFDLGRVLREGIGVLILGRPNVGKSSLMNALLGEPRAIVTEVAGTTRDTIEEQLVLVGFPVRLVDAAGVRYTEDPIEREGVRRAREKAAVADLVLMVVDGASRLNNDDLLALELCKSDKTLVVVNKCDQAQIADLSCFSAFPQVFVSAKYGLGLSVLRDSIANHFSSDTGFSGDEGVIVTERRHRDALLQAIVALERSLASLTASLPFECLAMDLRDALGALGLITGETTPDEILDQIFSRFCIGK